MAERMTEYFENGAYTEKQNIIDVSDKVKFFDNGCVMGKAIDKLAQLEDVMEDYNIKTVEELGKRLEDVEQYNYETNRQFIDVMAKYGIESIEELDKKLSDGITWQKACELACDILMPKSEIKTIQLNDDNQIINSKEAIDYFYQQAKQFAGR